MNSVVPSRLFTWGPTQDTRKNGYIVCGAVWLCSRELAVARALASGRSLQEVADSLGVAYSTADNYRTSVYGKLSVKTVVGLTHFMLSRGLIPNLYATQTRS